MACNECGAQAAQVYRDETDAHAIVCGRCYITGVLGVRAAQSFEVTLQRPVVYQVGGSDKYHETPTCSYFERTVAHGTKSIWVRQKDAVEESEHRPTEKCSGCFAEVTA